MIATNVAGAVGRNRTARAAMFKGVVRRRLFGERCSTPISFAVRLPAPTTNVRLSPTAADRAHRVNVRVRGAASIG
jgi:hypothetical protein